MDQPVVFVGENAVLNPVPPASAPPVPDTSTFAGSDMEAQLMEAIEAIRPALQADGGDVNVVGLDPETGIVDLELVGACGSCPASTMTLKAGIERILKDRVEGITAVNAVGMDPEF